jgi:hypothetical protein
MRNAMRLLGFVAAAGFVIATATPASANCSPNKTASTFTVGLAYWASPGPINQASLTGQFWQLGNRAGGNEGLCLTSGCGGAGGWLYFYGGDPNKLSVSAIMGSAEVAGCPTGTLITTAQVNSADGKETYFIPDTVVEVSGPAVDFAYGNQGDHSLAAIPRPRVLSQSRLAGQVTLHINIPSAAAGTYGPSAAAAITGYRLVSGNGVGAADSGREAAGYTTLQSFSGPQADVTQVIDCTGIVAPAEKFVGLQILFADGQVSRVGGTYRVGCDPAIATPKAPIAPKKGPGVRPISNN